MSEEAERETSTNYRLPTGTTLQHCAKLAVVEDKPIMFDYWTDSCDKKVLIGVRDGGEKLLVKSEEEYTSPVSKIYKVESEYIIITENSIYIVSADIATKRISGA
uniref:Uncharacterized protein n=1 Tax=viral metagenome TaxID=1070528 RepID=A0A6C0JBR6_9ZZZZ|tara:strand:+ start:1303 stop:1617 length:315 start_codon:yes stop_codon:yes gene_type:complete